MLEILVTVFTLSIQYTTFRSLLYEGNRCIVSGWVDPLTAGRKSYNIMLLFNPIAIKTHYELLYALDQSLLKVIIVYVAVVQ